MHDQPHDLVTTFAQARLGRPKRRLLCQWCGERLAPPSNDFCSAHCFEAATWADAAAEAAETDPAYKAWLEAQAETYQAQENEAL